MVTTAAGVGGGIGGAALGSAAGPFSFLVGGIFGGIVSANIANSLNDRLTQRVFDLPKNEALENAYRYLGVNHHASNVQVSAAFHYLCRKHHPDKGGNAQEFFILQTHMAIIKNGP